MEGCFRATLLFDVRFGEGSALVRRLRYARWAVDLLKTESGISFIVSEYNKLATLLTSALDVIAQVGRHTMVARCRNVVVH